MQSLETINSMKNIEERGTTYATAIDIETPPPKEHYFYAYQYSINGQWFSTLLYSTAEEARNNITDRAIIRKKLCCIVL